jgi:N-acetylglutamate synthase-like GNAT family acetyltransferase
MLVGMPIEIKQVSGYEELERWVTTRNEVAPDDIATVALKVLLRASQDGRDDLIAYDDGEVVGTGVLAGDAPTQRASHPYVEVMVPERHRGRGVGTALLEAFSARLRDLGKKGVQVEARSDDAYSIGFLERRGFVEVDRWTRLVLELDADEPLAPLLADGVEIVWLSERPDLVEALFQLAVASGRDLTGSFAAWQVYELGDPRIRLDLTAIALAGDDVVGYTTLVQLADERAGGHRTLTVRPDWRTRGIGAALTRAQIAAATRAEFKTLFAWARPWEHRDLYVSLGYEPRSTSIDFQGPLL